MHWTQQRGRRPAVDEPGHAHELTFTCLHSYPFLRSDRTCTWLADAIDNARRKWEFLLWANVFMPEHMHLLVVPRQRSYKVSRILSAIKEPVARKAIAYLEDHSPNWLAKITVSYGARIKRRFWQPGGGFDHNAMDPKVILRMIEYIHANPVRRGLVTHPDDWKWSSAGWREGKNPLRPDPVDFGGLTVYWDGRE